LNNLKRGIHEHTSGSIKGRFHGIGRLALLWQIFSGDVFWGSQERFCVIHERSAYGGPMNGPGLAN
jgi:hypothetical protein